jgi:glycerol-3-phosphate cytidylyltransferase-like family protein
MGEQSCVWCGKTPPVMTEVEYLNTLDSVRKSKYAIMKNNYEMKQISEHHIQVHTKDADGKVSEEVLCDFINHSMAEVEDFLVTFEPEVYVNCKKIC